MILNNTQASVVEECCWPNSKVYYKVGWDWTTKVNIFSPFIQLHQTYFSCMYPSELWESITLRVPKSFSKITFGSEMYWCFVTQYLSHPRESSELLFSFYRLTFSMPKQLKAKIHWKVSEESSCSPTLSCQWYCTVQVSDPLPVQTPTYWQRKPHCLHPHFHPPWLPYNKSQRTELRLH